MPPSACRITLRASSESRSGITAAANSSASVRRRANVASNSASNDVVVGVSVRRSRSVAVWAEARLSRYCAAALVPVRAGFTASRRPCTTYAWNASFTYGVGFGASNSRARFVSFSVNRSSGAPSHRSQRRPSVGWLASTAPLGVARRVGRMAPTSHDHVLRNQSVGSRSSSAGSALRLATVILTRMSSAPALAYSTVTSK